MKQSELNDKFAEYYQSIVADINKQLAHTPITDKEIHDLVDVKIHRLLDLEAKKRVGKNKREKAFQSLLNRPFVYEVSKERYIAFKVENKSGYRAVLIFKIKTSKGSIYVMVVDQSNTKDMALLCYTAHFFDRYVERIQDPKIIKRDHAIRDFIKNYLMTNRIMIKNEDEQMGGSIIGTFNKGLGLGNNLFNINLFTTFVSTNMLTDKQLNDKEFMQKMKIEDIDRENHIRN